MTEEEKYLFDLKGYMVLRSVLSSKEVDEINKLRNASSTFPLTKAMR
jgi:hypothetical protein